MTPEIRRRRLVALAIVLGAVIILAALVILRPRPERQRPPAVAPLVTVTTVTDEPRPVTVTGHGTVQPKHAITLVPQVSGLVVGVSENLQAGGLVAAGEVLVQIESIDYELAVQQARSQVAQAQVALALAREESETARQEWQRTSGAVLGGSDLAGREPGPLVLREPQLRQAEAQLDAARAALARAELDLRRCRLTAPFDGRISSENVAVGQYVRAGEVLAGLEDIATAEITVHLPDRELAWIQVAPTDTTVDPAVTSTTVMVHATFAGGRHTWPGRAVRLGGGVDPSSRQVPVVVEVDAPQGAGSGRPPLLTGLFVSVVFTSAPPPQAVTIARSTLRPGDVVWLVDAEERLRVRPVEVARLGLETAVIVDGLAPGERLVTSNLAAVIDGMQLRVDDQQPAAGGERP
jgi:RND family efflux transporter MFP subunit